MVNAFAIATPTHLVAERVIPGDRARRPLLRRTHRPTLTRVRGMQLLGMAPLKRRGRRRSLIASLLVVLYSASCLYAVSLLVPEQAGAAPSCTSSQANRFAGYLTTSADGTGNTYEGIQANISNQGGIPCSGGGSSCCNFIFDWVMLATPLTGTNDNARAHIQIGYFQYEGSCTSLPKCSNRTGARSAEL
jgi:hypothetical protein